MRKIYKYLLYYTNMRVVKNLDYNELRILIDIIDYKRNIGYPPDIRELGYKYKDIEGLVKMKIVNAHVSNKHTIVDIDDSYIDDILNLWNYKTSEITEDMINEVLNNEYIYVKDDLKDIIRKVIKKKLWLLIISKPGMGKTEILNALNILPRTIMLSGSLLDKHTLLKVLDEDFVKIILINEIDKCRSHAVFDILNEVYDERKYTVIANANNTRKLSESLLSRFIPYNLDYTNEEVMKIFEISLKKEGIENIDYDLLMNLYKKHRDIRKVINLYLLKKD